MCRKLPVIVTSEQIYRSPSACEAYQFLRKVYPPKPIIQLPIRQPSRSLFCRAHPLFASSVFHGITIEHWQGGATPKDFKTIKNRKRRSKPFKPQRIALVQLRLDMTAVNTGRESKLRSISSEEAKSYEAPVFRKSVTGLQCLSVQCLQCSRSHSSNASYTIRIATRPASNPRSPMPYPSPANGWLISWHIDIA